MLFADARETQEHVTYLALLEGLELSDHNLTFGRFDIVCPAVDDLETLLDLATNRLFYPDALTSTERLDEHWYIRIHAERVRPEPFAGWKEFINPLIRPSFSSLPLEVEEAFKLLALWDWQYFDEEDFEDDSLWFPPRIPFVLTVSDNPFERPTRRPPIERLLYEPVFDDSENEVGEQPQRPWRYDDQRQTKRFEQFIRDQVARLEAIETTGDEWRFMDRALGFLVKACFSEGLDQLLWHVVTMEALLDDANAQGASNRMKERIRLLYPDAARKGRAADTFKQVHSVRSKLVHGAIEQAKKKDLRDARTLARMAAERMLGLLGALKDAKDSGRLEATPVRTNILKKMDRVIQAQDLSSDPVAQVVAEIL